jgi:glyoxylase-like metal-dependent hydrolase (beta-lactamase superfamily II)
MLVKKRSWKMSKEAYYFSLGNFKLAALNDGTLVIREVEGEEISGLNCLFIDTGSHKVLIDTGGGGGFQATAGYLVKNMEAEGMKCSDIDRIIITHGHIDHVGGSYDSEGKPVFPNARYIVAASEWEHWLKLPGSNELHNMFFAFARNYFLPNQARFDLVEENAEVLPGIRLIAAPGHTPGNVMVEITSQGKRLLCIGDIIHSQVEFTNPEHLAIFDVTPEQAIQTRNRIFYDIAESGVLVFACHFPFPGLGHITQNEGVFAWQPIQE